MTSNRRPTMRDVAEAAGVSPALVSIIFRNAPGASEQTRQHVRDVAQRIGYVRDERARVLRNQRSTDIGVSFQTNQVFHSLLLDTLYEGVEDSEYNLVLSAHSPNRSEATALGSLVSYRCGAVILLGPALGREMLERLAAGTPVIGVAEELPAPHAWFATDDGPGFRDAITHLVGLGHRDIAFATSPGAGAQRREASYRAAMAEHGLAARIEAAGMTEDDGARLAQRLLEAGSLPTAIIGFNDRCALGIIDYCLRCGTRVPEDLSVVGVDDSEVSRRFYAGLTSIAQDTRRIGRLALERALVELRDEVADEEPRGVQLPSSLVIRSSTAPTARG
ncbi:MAG: LacI family transcriptional regulator [Luteococcus sp.]|uniref:LacI family DNA-binding transcriptional regulator n=1 Tax=Luteococcus sp. TaxID=1969402 RepID=UPI0026499CFF|nr:LacI family DNA-binding transcriptional regulator [Luteococcus sp.]MDN5563729.1 LacI family transcriptional regulator [Luteococcus sp.]